MKNFKKLLAVLLAGLMLLSLAACGGKDEGLLKSGTLELGSTGGYIEHLNETILASLNQKIEHTNYNNLSTALLDLESGKIDFLSCGQTTADYVIAHNDKFEVALEIREVIGASNRRGCVRIPCRYKNQHSDYFLQRHGRRV